MGEIYLLIYEMAIVDEMDKNLPDDDLCWNLNKDKFTWESDADDYIEAIKKKEGIKVRNFELYPIGVNLLTGLMNFE